MGYKDGSKQTGGYTYRQHQTLKRFIRERDKHTCQLCGQPGDVVDHINPWAISHDSTLANLRILCRTCNLAIRRKRHDASPFSSIDDYYAYLEREIAKES